MKIQIRKYKEIKKPCPKCGTIMEYDIKNETSYDKGTYVIYYECPNDCSLAFEDGFERIKTDETMIWYEEEEVEISNQYN